MTTLRGTAVSLDALDAALALRPYGVAATVQEASVRGRPGAVVDAGEDVIQFRAVVTDVVGPRGCDTGVAPSSVTVDLLDAAGRPLPCA